MPKKHSFGYIRKAIKSRNGELLSKFYRNQNTILEVRCVICDNINFVSFHTIWAGNWCRGCNKKRKSEKLKVPYSYVKHIIEERNCTLLSKEYHNNKQKLDVKCNICNHIWHPIFHNLNGGSGCPRCVKIELAKKFKYSFEYVKSYIEKHNCALLSNEYVNNRSLLQIKCSRCKYEWTTNFHDFSAGHHCKKCSIKRRTVKVSYSHTYVKNEIKKRGGTLLSKYKGYNKKIDVLCDKCKTIWQPTFGTIMRGHWCSSCHGNKRLTLQDFVIKAEKYNCKILSNKYKNLRTILEVQCNVCNKIFFKRCGALRRDQWCSCASRSKSQKLLYNILKEIYNDKKYKIYLDYKSFSWLYNKKTKGKQHIDIFITDDKAFTLAVEYDGEYHFKPVKYFGGKKKIKYTKSMDQRKTRLIKKHKNEIKYFVRFNYKEKITKEFVINKLKKNKIPVL